MSSLGVPASRCISSVDKSTATESEAALIQILKLEELDPNLYRGYSPEKPRWGRIYGGQTVSQSLIAAGSTVNSPFVAHSLHAYFLRPGDDTIPILYQVERLRNGHSFCSRHVTAIQRGEAIFTMSVSFQIPEIGLTHEDSMPKVPSPDILPSLNQTLAKWSEDSSLPDKVRAGIKRSSSFPFPIELRRISPSSLEQRLSPGEPNQICWMRVTGRLSDSLLLHQCALAYLSDWSLLETSLLSHGIHRYTNPNLQMASIDHSMWFHAPFRADQNLLYVMHSPRASGGRGLAFGQFFTEDGQLVVSCAQEGLIRIRTAGSFDKQLNGSNKPVKSKEKPAPSNDMYAANNESQQSGNSNSTAVNLSGTKSKLVEPKCAVKKQEKNSGEQSSNNNNTHSIIPAKL